MNSSPLPADLAADETAALWAARLDGSTLTTADRAALDRWLAAAPSHRALLSRYCQLGADLEERLPALVISGAVALPDEKRKISRRAKILLWTGAPALLAAAAALAFFLVADRAARPEIFSTPAAQRHTVALADGSTAELNARTSLAVAFTRTERHVRLDSGEAFFSVTKDPARPFVVETPSGTVRVTGTRFAVSAGPAATLDVTVAEGSVQVRPAAGAPVALTGSDHLAVSSDGVAVRTLTTRELDAALAWRQGEIVFDDVPLAEALARFARYHDRAITAAPGAAGLRLSARLKLDDLAGFFTSLEELLPVRTERTGDRTTVSLRTGK